jgi:hypothetical protein
MEKQSRAKQSKAKHPHVEHDALGYACTPEERGARRASAVAISKCAVSPPPCAKLPDRQAANQCLISEPATYRYDAPAHTELINHVLSPHDALQPVRPRSLAGGLNRWLDVGSPTNGADPAKSALAGQSFQPCAPSMPACHSLQPRMRPECVISAGAFFLLPY